MSYLVPSFDGLLFTSCILNFDKIKKSISDVTYNHDQNHNCHVMVTDLWTAI